MDFHDEFFFVTALEDPEDLPDHLHIDPEDQVGIHVQEVFQLGQ